MVGWNVAATYLVVDRVLHKISDLFIFTSATIFSVNDMMNLLNECLCECMLIPLCMINNYRCV